MTERRKDESSKKKLNQNELKVNQETVQKCSAFRSDIQNTFAPTTKM